jgi:hypothetical protein
LRPGIRRGSGDTGEVDEVLDGAPAATYTYQVTSDTYQVTRNNIKNTLLLDGSPAATPHVIVSVQIPINDVST